MRVTRSLALHADAPFRLTVTYQNRDSVAVDLHDADESKEMAAVTIFAPLEFKDDLAEAARAFNLALDAAAARRIKNAKESSP
jgi:hypothetical protein